MHLCLCLNLFAPHLVEGDSTPGGLSDVWLMEDSTSGWLMDDGINFWRLE